MKATTTVKEVIEVKTLRVSAGVRYWEDATVNDVEDEEGNLIPCREGDCWCPIIDIDSGIITNWVKGITADIHYKVCDDGKYELLDESGKVVATRNGYVPSVMCPKENGYGDYIIMDVDEHGKIADWEPKESYFELGDE